MKSLFFAFFALATIALLPSCGCDYADTNIDNCVPKIKRMSLYNANGKVYQIIESEYNGDGNVSRTVSKYYNDGGTEISNTTTTFSYNDNKIELSDGSYYSLYDDGMVISNSMLTGQNITYDSDGFITEIQTGTEAYVHYYENGNLDKIDIEYSNNVAQPYSQYAYYTDKENTIGNQNMGQPYLGKQSKNLAKTITGQGTPLEYTYDFYSNGNVKAVYRNNYLHAEYEYY